MTLQVSWRQWLTGELLTRWLSEQRYYRLAITDEEQINPEYRIADDLRLASEPVVEFAIGFINALLAAITFVGILFWVGGSLTVTIGGTTLWIPGLHRHRRGDLRVRRFRLSPISSAIRWSTASPPRTKAKRSSATNSRACARTPKASP